MPTPSWAEAWLMAKRSDDPMLDLLTVMHPAFGVYRFVRDPVAFTSRGQVFSPAWFDVDEINDDGNLPRVMLSFPNVDPEIGRKLLRQATCPEVTVEAVALSMPDEPIKFTPRLDLRVVHVGEVITGQLMGKDHSTEPLGTVVVLPSNFPALYRRQRKT